MIVLHDLSLSLKELSVGEIFKKVLANQFFSKSSNGSWIHECDRFWNLQEKNGESEESMLQMSVSINMEEHMLHSTCDLI